MCISKSSSKHFSSSSARTRNIAWQQLTKTWLEKVSSIFANNFPMFSFKRCWKNVGKVHIIMDSWIESERAKNISCLLSVAQKVLKLSYPIYHFARFIELFFGISYLFDLWLWSFAFFSAFVTYRVTASKLSWTKKWNSFRFFCITLFGFIRLMLFCVSRSTYLIDSRLIDKDS